jgi:hypothetical protein
MKQAFLQNRDEKPRSFLCAGERWPVKPGVNTVQELEKAWAEKLEVKKLKVLDVMVHVANSNQDSNIVFGWRKVEDKKPADVAPPDKTDKKKE